MTVMTPRDFPGRFNVGDIDPTTGRALTAADVSAYRANYDGMYTAANGQRLPWNPGAQPTPQPGGGGKGGRSSPPPAQGGGHMAPAPNPPVSTGSAWGANPNEARGAFDAVFGPGAPPMAPGTAEGGSHGWGADPGIARQNFAAASPAPVRPGSMPGHMAPAPNPPVSTGASAPPPSTGGGKSGGAGQPPPAQGGGKSGGAGQAPPQGGGKSGGAPTFGGNNASLPPGIVGPSSMGPSPMATSPGGDGYAGESYGSMAPRPQNPTPWMQSRSPMYGQVGTQNPWLDNQFNRAADAVEGRMRGATAFQGLSNSGIQQQYNRNLNDLATGVYGGAYEADANRRLQSGMAISQMQQQARENDLSRMMQASQGLPGLLQSATQYGMGLGDVYRDERQAMNNEAIRAFEEARLHPYQNLEVLANAIRTGFGGGGTSTTTSPGYYQPSSTAGIFGTGLGILGALRSLNGGG